MSKSKSKKGRTRRKKYNTSTRKSTSAMQERRQNAREIRILQARKERGGGVAPRRNGRKTESAPRKAGKRM